MKLTTLKILSCLTVLGACSVETTSEFCDVSVPFHLDHPETIDYLVSDEPQFVRDVLAHNEIHEEMCG